MNSPADISPLSRLLMRIDAAADGTRAPDGIGTGFPSLDERLGGGVRAGDLIVLGGDVGAGKSALALAIALRVRASGRPTLLLCGEMTSERVLERILAIEGRARVDDLRRGKVSEEVRAALGATAVRMREGMPIIDRLPDGASDVQSIVRSTPGVELVVIDSLQCFSGSARPHHEELASAIITLKATAMDEGVAMLVTSHLSGRAADAGDARPSLDDFGAMGAVKQLADVVLGIHREELYDPNRGSDGATELHLLKNRNGNTSYIDLYFFRQWLRFEDMVEP